MNTLMTIGYEGVSIDEFLQRVIQANINIVIDIREVPISRKKGFSKKAISNSLNSAGIEYIHLKNLGDPKAGREAARRGDINEFERIFFAHLKTGLAQVALDEAEQIISSKKACLLCYEKDHTNCHRLIVANAIEERQSLNISHL